MAAIKPVSRNTVQDERITHPHLITLRAMQALARFGEQKDTFIWCKKGIFTLQT
jgi:hypothetical protein